MSHEERSSDAVAFTRAVWACGLLEFDGPVIGFGVSFPKTKDSAPVTYTVNNVYWEQE